MYMHLCFQQFDELFNQGQMLVTRVSSLGAHFKEMLRHFQSLCVKAKVVGEDDNSLENCLVGLKDALAQRNITLKVMMIGRRRRMMMMMTIMMKER